MFMCDIIKHHFDKLYSYIFISSTQLGLFKIYYHFCTPDGYYFAHMFLCVENNLNCHIPSSLNPSYTDR